VIAEGSPEEIAADPGSSTGAFLKETLAKQRKKAGPASKSNGAARSRRKVAVG
jgi:hypothetical protein